jgi:hypothetical protein
MKKIKRLWYEKLSIRIKNPDIDRTVLDEKIENFIPF